MNTLYAPRPSRTYKDGVGKPVVAKRFDEIVGKHQWMLVFPPVNNFGQRLVVEEARLCGKAEDWCDDMNERIRRADIAKATGETL